jgi:hypothetical protein
LFFALPVTQFCFCLEFYIGSVGASVAGMNEDGSFIGKYRKDRNPDQSSAFATLV